MLKEHSEIQVFDNNLNVNEYDQLEKSQSHTTDQHMAPPE